MAGPLVWITAGEASGDMVGSMLARRLRTSRPDLRIEVVGGSRLAEASDRVLANSSRWGAMGIVRSLVKVKVVYRSYRSLLRRAATEPPALHIPIDFGAFNVPLARRLRQFGSKVLYYMPPGSWRKERQGTDLPKVADEIATPFEWSERLLRNMGADAHWVGHPLLDRVPEAPSTVREPLLALLPGSRDHEIGANLPVMLRACDLLSKDDSDLRFELALAPGSDEGRLSYHVNRLTNLPVRLVHDAVDLLCRARAAIVCSGTATLEAAVCGCPLVVLYRGDWLMQLEAFVRRPRFQYLALPSIVLGRKLCPELIQRDASAERIAAEVGRLVTETPERREQLEGFQEVRSMLGTPGATDRTAALALSLLPGREPVTC